MRSQIGGYHAAETSLVLDGELDLDNMTLRCGDLTHVPAEFVRGGMATRQECTALAWFSGPATFLAREELAECRLEISSVCVLGAATGALLATPEADWSLVESTDGEGVDVALTRWALDASPLAGPVVARSRR